MNSSFSPHSSTGALFQHPLTSSAARVSLAAFCTFFPALDAAALASAAAVLAFFETASLAARAAALASRGEADPAGTEGASAEADDDAEAPALGVVAAERSAGVEARDERGVNDFLRDSPSFFERVRFSSVRAAAAESAILFFLFLEREWLRGGGGGREVKVSEMFFGFDGFIGRRRRRRQGVSCRNWGASLAVRARREFLNWFRRGAV